MARTIKATMPSGEVVELEGVPETATEEQIKAKLQARLGEAPTELSTGWLDTAKLLGSAAARGIAGVGGMAQDALRNVAKGPMEAAEVLLGRRGLGDMQGIADKLKNTTEVGQMGTQPLTPGQRYASSIAEGAAGGLVGGVGGLGRSALIGATSGLGAEAAGTATSQNPLARIAGALAGGSLAGVATGAKTTRADLAREVLRDAKDSDLDQAVRNMRDTRDLPFPNSGINLSQAMPEASNIDSAVGKLANSRYGTHVSEQLRRQPKEASMLVENELQQLPGTNRPWQDVANRAQEAATARIKQEKDAAGGLWRKTFNDSTASQGGMNAVDPNTIDRLATDLIAKADASGLNTAKGQGLKHLARSLYNRDGEPITDPTTLNEILKDAAGRAKPVTLASRGKDAGASKYLQSQVAETRNALGDASKPFRDANATFKSYTESVVEPLKKSVIGDIAGRSGAVPDRQAVISRVKSVFDNGTVPDSSRSEILTLQKQLQKSDPEAYTDAAKSWIAQKITDAGAPSDNRFPEDFAKKLVAAFGNTNATVSKQSKGLEDTLVGLARAKGQPDNTYLGLPKLMRYIAATSNRPARVEGASSMDFDRVSGSATANTLARGSVFNPFRPALIMWDSLLRGDANRFVDKLITTPEGVEVLRSMAKTGPHDKKVQAALATFAATLATGPNGKEAPAE